jgi:hypothetical protein
LHKNSLECMKYAAIQVPNLTIDVITGLSKCEFIILS